MKLQPESKKELLRIACGVSLCTAVMWVVFAALHLVGWVVFDYRVLLGGIIGALVAATLPASALWYRRSLTSRTKKSVKRSCRYPIIQGCCCRRCGSS